MAAPNVVNVATITAKSAAVDLSTTNNTLVLSNAESSGKVFKLNQLIVVNDDGTNSANITVTFVSKDAVGDGGAVSYNLAKTVAVPAGGMLVVIDKSTAMYIEEDRSIYAQASAANDLDVIASYEEIS
tara:strand:+ start:1045 stop:1428 length:384 start_codon:yes stop_codon:yes gene_type:complete